MPQPDRPLDAFGPVNGIGKHDHVERPRRDLAWICRSCGVVYLRPEGNCLLCSKFTQPVEMDRL